MKKGILLLLLIYAISGDAQNIYPWDGYIFPFCTDENPYGITYKSGTKGYAAFPKKSDIGCLGSAPCPVWYYMQIDNPGDLLIFIKQVSLKDNILLDVDFACWGPFQAKSKHDFLNKLKNSYSLETAKISSHRPSKGNHSNGLGGYPMNNLVDCSFTTDGTEWCFIPDAKSGEWYLLLITNYSRQPGEIHFERVANQSTATTRCDVTIPISINPIPNGLKQINDSTSAVCIGEEKALVTIELEPDQGFTLSNKSLKKTKVNLYANGKTYKATFVNGHFECEIDIIHDTTVYYADIKCPDPEFELHTPNHYLVKSKDCIPTQHAVTHMDTINAGSIGFEDFVLGKKSVRATIPKNDELSNLNLDDYDISVEKDNLFIESVTITSEGNDLILTPKLRGGWCGCFLPDQITVNVVLTPKSSEDGGSQSNRIVIPISVQVSETHSWISRCMWVLILLAMLLVFIIYLNSLLKKKRFKKNACIKQAYYNRNEDLIEQNSTQLRKRGFIPWFCRWFLPMDEKRVVSTERPRASITFYATESKGIVSFPKACFNRDRMFVDGYDPEINIKEKHIKLHDNGVIDISRANGTKDGRLVFSAGKGNDEGGYRLFVGLLIILSVCMFVLLAFLMTKGLLG